MKLLVLVHNNFNDMELVSVLSVFNKSGQFEEVEYHNPSYSEANGQHGVVKMTLHKRIKFDDYDAIFIPGGAGAQELRNDKESIELIKKFKDAGKYIFAICDAPNVLFENGIIDNETVYSSYPISYIDTNSGKLRNEAQATNHGKIFTGKAPASSVAFALLVIKILFGQEKHDSLKKALYGDR
ncbi:DJ-1/PfpI family protein [Mycoplasmopsis primatum]|uniref:DJ-1/PfpI family protein n=1 Tax=Mycoplasmopsis primatum TaxID=55604 RepID=UPI00049672C1|nr:DJ-1/PfpI family protein [Mycoplasmopsis primatum]